MIKTKKSLGQHFLIDDNILRKIVDSIPGSGGQILEIGAGTGTLSSHLMKRFDKVKVIEVDGRAVEYLKEHFPGLDIHQADVLKTDLSAFCEPGSKLNVVGNLPYNITSPILFQLLDNSGYFGSAVLLIQEEVARRLVAPVRTKDYGILTVQHQVMAEVEYLFKVSKNVFRPMPKVDSAVVRITFKHPQLACTLTHLKTVVRTAFNQRRKKLSNALKPVIIEKEAMSKVAQNFDLTRRAEELSPDEYVKLTRALEDYDILT